MNIFVFNEDPVLAANDHCVKHMIKMPLELTQMLCSNVNINNIVTPYRTCHINHPCTKWIRDSRDNFEWACEHTQALFDNYTLFFHKRHKSQDVFDIVKKYKDLYPNIGLTPFAQAMPDQYKSNNAVVSYRNYFKYEKAYLAVWKNKIPDWF